MKGCAGLKLTLNPQGKRARLILCLAAAVIFPAALLWGYVTVTKNCYNAMNEIPMTVFAVTESDSGEKSLIFLNETVFEW